MLGQVGLSSLLILTRMISYAYYILKPKASGYQGLIDTFLMSFTIILYYANFAKSFYIYTLTSHLFRSTFIHRIKSLIRKVFGEQILLTHNHNGVHVLTSTMAHRNTIEQK